MVDTRISLIEELAANAWRPEIEQSLDGWRLRYNQGVNRRCNSVWPNQLGGNIDLEERLDLVEAFYARWQIRPRYQLCPAAKPENLAEILAERGYTDDAHTAVQIAPIRAVHKTTLANPDYLVEIAPKFNQPWFDLYTHTEGLDKLGADMRQGTLNRIGSQAGFAILRIDGKTVAVGLGVLERGWVGIFCMATHPSFRRQGAASSLLNALASWGKEQGANEMYLQVMENNPPALALYAYAGFEKVYQYYYAEGPVD